MIRRIGAIVAGILVAGSLVVGAAPMANASAHRARDAACHAGLARLRMDRGRFDTRYDHILVEGIIGTACASGPAPAAIRDTCAVARQMFGEASPLFKTAHDRRLGRGVRDATCG